MTDVEEYLARTESAREDRIEWPVGFAQTVGSAFFLLREAIEIGEDSIIAQARRRFESMLAAAAAPAPEGGAITREDDARLDAIRKRLYARGSGGTDTDTEFLLCLIDRLAAPERGAEAATIARVSALADDWSHLSWQQEGKHEEDSDSVRT